jgi:hypothetical protein
MARKSQNTDTQDQAQAQEAPRQPTFALDDPVIQELVRQAVEAALASRKASEKASDTDRIDQQIVRAFQKRGFSDVVLLDRTKPIAQQLSTVTCLTYSKWINDCGRKVKPGEKAIAVKQYRLFHRSQTEPATPQERKEYFRQQQERAARRESRADQQPSA